jgi:hypothetical protein
VSDKKETPAALTHRTEPSLEVTITVPHGYSGILGVKYSPAEVLIPDVGYRFEELAERVVLRVED